MRYNNATFTLDGIILLYIFRSSGPLLGHKKAVVVVGHCVGEGVGRVRASRINALFLAISLQAALMKLNPQTSPFIK